MTWSRRRFVYTSVAIRNWRAFTALGVHETSTPPGAYHSSIRLTRRSISAPTRACGRRMIRSSSNMMRAPCKPGLDERATASRRRAELLGTGFEVFERNIRDQLARTLGPGGFDPAADIIAITVNRWPHGYAYEYNRCSTPTGTSTSSRHVIGRAPFGRITIANSDSGAGAYTDCAIEQAHRAIAEVIAIMD